MTAAGPVGGAGRARYQINTLIEQQNSGADPASASAPGAPVGARGLEVPRRRQTPASIGLAAGVVTVAVALMAAPALPQSAAQIAAQGAIQGDTTTVFPLLSPSLDGNPQNPPVFRKAKPQPPDDTTAPVGQLPDFDYRPSIGSGTTGFNSSNTRPAAPKIGTPGASQPPGLDAAAQGATAPKSPAKPGQAAAAVALTPVPSGSAIGDARLQQNQNQTRRGAAAADATAGTDPAAAAALAAAPGLGSPAPDPALAVPKTLVRRPVVDDNPFGPTGIAAGSFLLRPAIELSGGYDTNPARTNGGGGASNLGIVAPELQVNSNWSRHELTADLRGSYTAYGAAAAQDRPAFDGKIDGRIDVTSRTRIDLESRLLVATDNPGSPNIQAGLARLPVSTDVGGSIGLGQRFNRLDVELKGGIDRTTYQDSVFTDGTSASNDDRNFDQYSTQLRAGYELSPAVKPFVEIDADRRQHDLAADRFGIERDSQGRAVKIGTTFEFSRILTGQLAFGYLERNYADPTLPEIKGPTLDGSLIWLASALTTVKLTAATSVDESTLVGVAGVFTHEVGIEVDHAFRTWLDASLKFTGDRDTYVGQPRQDDRYAGALALTYKMSREMQLKGELRREWLTSNMPTNNYQAYVALLGVRLQR